MNTQAAIYHPKDRESTPKLKEKIGCLLLCLLTGEAQPDGWRRFELLLRRYYAGGQI